MVASAPILATKLYISPPPPKVVLRTRLIELPNERVRVSAGRTPGVAFISAPAGFGKTTLVSEWVATLTPSAVCVRAGEVCIKTASSGYWNNNKKRNEN